MAEDGAPVEIDLERRRGDTFARRFAIKQNGSALDITGATFLKSVNSDKEPGDTANQLYQVNGAVVDAIGGIVEFPLSVVDADQVPGTYYYDVQMTDSAGRKRTIVTGKIKFKQDITKD